MIHTQNNNDITPHYTLTKKVIPPKKDRKTVLTKFFFRHTARAMYLYHCANTSIAKRFAFHTTLKHDWRRSALS